MQKIKTENTLSGIEKRREYYKRVIEVAIRNEISQNFFGTT